MNFVDFYQQNICCSQFMCQRAQIVNDGLEKIQFRVQSATLQQTAPWKQLWSVCIDGNKLALYFYIGVTLSYCRSVCRSVPKFHPIFTKLGHKLYLDDV